MTSAQRPASIGDLQSRMREHAYLADRGLATAIYLALRLGRPLLLEGDAGVGKTEVSKVVAGVLGAELIRLQCYEGIDASQALYEWDYARQLLHLRAVEAAGRVVGRAEGDAGADRVVRRAEGDAGADRVVGRAEGDAGADRSGAFAYEADLYTPRFLLERPLLAALRRGDRAVLLIDEVDRADDEFEAFLLEVLSDFQVTIPELGTIRAAAPPVVVLTSNRSRELHEALKRRCLYHWIDHPGVDREAEIVLVRAPEVPEPLARTVAELVGRLRGLDLYKPPGVAETIDWARVLTLLATGNDGPALDAQTARDTLGTVVKDRDDLQRARDALDEVLGG